MGNFDIIEYGYNIADETVNFGTRSLADGDNLYEACTLATFKCSEAVPENSTPHINAFVKGGCVYFNVDTLLRIFKDKQCSDIIFNAKFEAIVDSFCVTNDGKYLLLCLRDGMVHVIDCSNEYNCVFSHSCERDEDGDKFFIDSFLDVDCFFIVSKLGQVYQLMLNQDFKFKCLHEFNFVVKIASLQYPFLLVSGSRLAVLDIENENTLMDEGCDFKTIFPLSHMFFALDVEGHFFRICAITLMIFPVENSTLYKDMKFVADSKEKQVIVVTENEENQHYIELLSYPGLDKMYGLKIKNDVHLIASESTTEELLFISKITENNSVSELRFHEVYETEPEQRLWRLLKKHKYEEAERFATTFHLDHALINQAKAQEIVDKTTCSTDEIDNLINLLNIIDDDIFKLNCCLGATCSKFNDVRKILEYGCKLQLKKQDKKAEEVQKSVFHLMSRFETFMTVYRGTDMVMQTWLQFTLCDLLDEVKYLLRNHQIEEAKIIYSRLDDTTIENLTDAKISDILKILNNLPISTYQSFLPTFVSATLSIQPSTLPLFINWTHRKVFSLEEHAKTDFPMNAIKFAEKIVGLMKVNDVGNISFQRQCVLHRESLAELSLLLSTLKTLQTLKGEYGISIPVAYYLSGPQNVIKFLLNTEMRFEHYSHFIENFVCKYIIEKQLDLNEILLAEIKDLMNYEEICWVNIIGSILNCMSSVKAKLEGVQTILEFAKVPWSDPIRKIGNDSLKYSHPLTSEIMTIIESEPIQIVLRKPKYDIKEKRIRNINDLKYIVSRIIYCNDSTMVEDVYTLCGKNMTYRHEANMLLINHFIRIGCAEKALKILDNNEEEEIRNCVKELTLMIQTVVNNEVKLPDEIVDNYYNIAESIFKRLNDEVTNEFDRICNNQNLELTRNVYNLKKYFQISATTYDLRNKSFKNIIIEDVLQTICSEFESNQQNIDQVFLKCQKLATSLSLNVHEVLIRLCEKVKDYNIIVRTAQSICNKETSARNLSLIAVLLLKYVGTYKLQLSADNTFSESEGSLLLADSENIIDDDLFCKGLQLAQVITAKAIGYAEPDEIMSCMEVANWTNISFYFSRNQENDLRKMPTFLTFSTTNNAFNSVCGFIGQLKNPNTTFLTYFPSESLTEEEFFHELEVLPPIFENLIKEGQNFSSFKIIKILQNCLIQVPTPNEKILTFLNEVLQKKCIPKLLSIILSNNIIDTDLLYNLLLLLNCNDAAHFVINSLRMYKRHPRKFACICRTGLRLWDFHKLSSGKSEMINSLVTLKWWNKFETKKLPYDHFFKSKAEERFELLVNSDCFGMKLAQEYCKDYNLDPQASYKYFLKKVLQNWKPDYEVKNDLTKSYLVVKNDEEGLLKKCREIMEGLDHQQVCDIIANVWNKINTYYYEVFIAMLKILCEIDPTRDEHVHFEMLYFLKNYQRVSKPSKTEIEQWYTIFPDTQSLEVLSEFRLPFTPVLFTKQVFSIIKPEMNLKTYRMWFNVVEILKPFISKNEICSYVIKEVVASGVLTRNESEPWILAPKHQDLLKEIDECVMNISDLELASSVMYHLMTSLSHGADQVTAASLCYKYALEYRRLNPSSSSVEKAVTKVEKKYFTYWAMHILHTYGLSDKKYIDLLTRPNELILELYLDDRILGKGEVNLHCPDINKAAEALAEFFKLDIRKIRVNLIKTWLDDDVSNFDFDSSMIYPNGESNEDGALNRIAYICCADEVSYWQTFLFQMGLGGEAAEQKSARCKANALKVFVMISDVETVAQMADISYDEFMNFLDKLTLVSNLQYLGFGLDVEALDQYNKKELLNRLAQRVGNVLAIKTMALICMTYQIYHAKYWEFILNNAIKFSLFVELKGYLTFLKKVKYQYKNFYINAWQNLIDNSFTNLNVSQQLDQTLLNNLLYIQSCPVLYSLNFDKVFRKCIEVTKVEFAAVLLQYIGDNQKEEYVKKVRKSSNDVIETCLNYLAENGVWGISYVREILHNNY